MEQREIKSKKPQLTLRSSAVRSFMVSAAPDGGSAQHRSDPPSLSGPVRSAAHRAAALLRSGMRR